MLEKQKQAQFDDEDHACFIVLGLGPRADVLEQAKLSAAP